MRCVFVYLITSTAKTAVFLGDYNLHDQEDWCMLHHIMRLNDRSHVWLTLPTRNAIMKCFFTLLPRIGHVIEDKVTRGYL